MESQDGMVEGLMYARSEGDDHERRTLASPPPFPSPCCLSHPSSLQPASPISPSFSGERERRPSLSV
jgi:hypothetical protein